MQNGRNSYFDDCHRDVITGIYIHYWVTSCSVAMSQTLSFGSPVQRLLSLSQFWHSRPDLTLFSQATWTLPVEFKTTFQVYRVLTNRRRVRAGTCTIKNTVATWLEDTRRCVHILKILFTLRFVGLRQFYLEQLFQDTHCCVLWSWPCVTHPTFQSLRNLEVWRTNPFLGTVVAVLLTRTCTC